MSTPPTPVPAADPAAQPKAPTAEELLALTTPASQPITTGKAYRQDFYDGSHVESDDPKEFAAKVAERWNNLTQHTRQVEAENKALKQQTATVAQVVSAPQHQSPDIATKFWELANQNKISDAVALALADYLQIGDPSVLPQAVQRWESVADKYTTREVVGAFSELAPDFPLGDPAAADVLTAKLSEMGVKENQMAPPELMFAAHQLCIKENRYAGTTYKAAPLAAAPEGLPPVAPPIAPLPTISAGGASDPAPNIEQTANNMSPAELRRALEEMVKQGQK